MRILDFLLCLIGPALCGVADRDAVFHLRCDWDAGRQWRQGGPVAGEGWGRQHLSFIVLQGSRVRGQLCEGPLLGAHGGQHSFILNPQTKRGQTPLACQGESVAELGMTTELLVSDTVPGLQGLPVLHAPWLCFGMLNGKGLSGCSTQEGICRARCGFPRHLPKGIWTSIPPLNLNTSFGFQRKH